MGPVKRQPGPVFRETRSLSVVASMLSEVGRLGQQAGRPECGRLLSCRLVSICRITITGTFRPCRLYFCSISSPTSFSPQRMSILILRPSLHPN